MSCQTLPIGSSLLLGQDMGVYTSAPGLTAALAWLLSSHDVMGEESKTEVKAKVRNKRSKVGAAGFMLSCLGVAPRACFLSDEGKQSSSTPHACLECSKSQGHVWGVGWPL